MPTGRSVLLAGATGLVGRECLRLLLEAPDVARLVVLTRRALPSRFVPDRFKAKLEVYEIDFSRLDQHLPLFNVDQIVCTLGTTLKQAGSRERFRTVDFDYVQTLARMGVKRGVHHFILVSSLGANPKSRIFYNRVKGEIEQAVRGLPYRGITILRPSLLLGERTEVRPGERIASFFAFLTPRKYKPVPARLVAAAIVRAAREDAQGVRIIESEAM
jgi:uncharacterized protein YbjT (DUF2867 family)